MTAHVRDILWLLATAACVFGAALAEAATMDDETDVEAAVVPAEPPAPPRNLEARDKPHDAGHAIILSWELSPDDDLDLPEEERVIGYRLYRAKAPFDPADLTLFNRLLLWITRTRPPEELEFKLAHETDLLPPQLDEYEDENRREIRPNIPYQYRLVAVGVGDIESEPVEIAETIMARRSWFDPNRSWFLALTVLISFWIILFIYLARKGAVLKIRKIAGLEAVDEAVGRATEMGRPILFVPGIQDMNNIQTVAGITILARLGRIAAEYDARLEVPTSRSLVMTTARETLESSFLAAGRPDAYHEDMSYYVTDEQFGYVAYLTGYMVREKPAACFYLGAFFAESLILAETGNSIGAIQVAGTAEPAQLPFFVAACDYTLIGEEFFAASAYLSGEPEQLGTLKGQDAGKIIGGLLIILGCLLATSASVTDDPRLHASVNYLMFSVLGTDQPPEELLDPELLEQELMEDGPEEEAAS